MSKHAMSWFDVARRGLSFRGLLAWCEGVFGCWELVQADVQFSSSVMVFLFSIVVVISWLVDVDFDDSYSGS